MTDPLTAPALAQALTRIRKRINIKRSTLLGYLNREAELAEITEERDAIEWAIAQCAEKQTWCEHFGGLGPPFTLCAICAAAALRAAVRGAETPPPQPLRFNGKVTPNELVTFVCGCQQTVCEQHATDAVTGEMEPQACDEVAAQSTAPTCKSRSNDGFACQLVEGHFGMHRALPDPDRDSMLTTVANLRHQGFTGQQVYNHMMAHDPEVVCKCGEPFDWHAPAGGCVGKDCLCKGFEPL